MSRFRGSREQDSSTSEPQPRNFNLGTSTSEPQPRNLNIGTSTSEPQPRNLNLGTPELRNPVILGTPEPIATARQGAVHTDTDLPCNRSAFAITDTELKLIAAAAIIGLSRMPNDGYSTPAATGTPSAL